MSQCDHPASTVNTLKNLFMTKHVSFPQLSQFVLNLFSCLLDLPLVRVQGYSVVLINFYHSLHQKSTLSNDVKCV